MQIIDHDLPPDGALVSIPNLPEMGTCRILRQEQKDRIKLFSLASRNEFLLSLRTQTLFRFCLTPSVKVQIFDPEAPGKLAVGTVTEQRNRDEEELYYYAVQLHDGRQVIIREDELAPLGGGNPVSELCAFNWHDPKEYFARWALQDLYSRWCEGAGGLPGMLGARVRPLGHQLYSARRVLWDRLPRFVLADEVGLGKTIETGLILQALLTQDPQLRVLVIAPGSMSRQWLAELYLRFGARAFVHADTSRLLTASEAERKALAKQPRLIVSSTALTADPSFAKALASQEWGVVVIDEAHQFPPGSPLYALFQELALNTLGLLLLSATPSKRDVASLAGLLALVAPDVYRPDDGERLEQRQAQQQNIWDRLNLTTNLLESARAGSEPLDQEVLEFLAEEWDELLPDDPNAQTMLDRLRTGETDATTELVAYVQEFYRLDHRIIRNRRKTLRQIGLAWASRQHVALEYEPSRDEAIFLGHMEELPAGTDLTTAALRGLYWRFAASTADNALAFLRKRQTALATSLAGEQVDSRPENSLDWLLTDPGPDDEQWIIEQIVTATPPLANEGSWLATAVPLAEAWMEAGTCARLQAAAQWIKTHLDQSPEHEVLVFVQDIRAVEEAAAWLHESLGLVGVRTFHAGMPEAELAEVAFVFQHDPKCRLLVSDELGGEGRNFQNASAVVHLDLPLSTARLEQRIGRLDRIGRAADYPVVSVTITGTLRAEEALLSAHAEVFRVFECSVGGLEFILPRLQRELAVAYSEGAPALKQRLPVLSAQVDEALAATDEAFELSLDATKPQLDLATEQAQHLDETVSPQLAEEIVTRWARRIGIRTRRLEEGASELKWEADSLRVSLPGLDNSQGGFIQGTFDRAQALAHENLQYLGPGHQLVDSMLTSLGDTDLGRVTALAVPYDPAFSGTWLLHVLVRSRIDETLWADEGMTPGLALRAHSAYWPEVLPELVALFPGKESAAKIVTHSTVRKLFASPTELPDGAFPIQREQLPEIVNVADLFDALAQGAELARSAVARRQSEVASVRARHLEQELRAEMGWLSWRSGQESAGAAQAALADMKAREALLRSVEQPIAEIEGLALICLC